MSIQTLDEEGATPDVVDANAVPYVPDGIYEVPDSPDDNDEPTLSIPTVDLSAQSASASTTSANTSLVPANDVEAAKLCGVCKEKEYKYKCSRCYLPYCSIACSAIHKATHPHLPPPPPAAKPGPTEPPKPSAFARAGTTAAAGLASPFADLDSSAELRALFKHYPNLHLQLSQIYTAMQPPSDASPDLYEKLTGKHNHQNAWNQDRGLKRGREALDKARDAWGKDGEGVREYGELVLRIVEGVDAEELVRGELERENARIVKALLDGEL